MISQDMITLILLNSLWVFGLYELFSCQFFSDNDPSLGVHEESKGLLWFVKYYSVKRFGWFYSKPICVCPPCMASIHSTYFFAAYWYFSGGTFSIATLAIYLIYAIALTGLNSLLTKLTHR